MKIQSFAEFVNESNNSNVFEESTVDITSEDISKLQSALPDLEKLIFKTSKVKVKLTATQSPNFSKSISIESEDLLKDGSVIDKAMFTSLKLRMNGGKFTDGVYSFVNISFKFELKSRGSNGVSALWSGIWWDSEKNKWTTRPL